MKKAVFLLILFMIAFVVGCDDEAFSLSGGHGMVDTKQQRRRRIATIMDMNDRSLQDDFDEMLLIDNNSKLSPWEITTGN